MTTSVPEASATRNLRVREPYEAQRGRHGRYPVLASEVPIIADVDVLVVGGGTAGAIAAITAAQEGVRVAVVEMNPGLGGTATYGGVRHYWAGWQGGFTAISRGWVNKVHDQVRYPRRMASSEVGTSRPRTRRLPKRPRRRAQMCCWRHWLLLRSSQATLFVE